jgi:FkbM family methyltransferase
MRLRRSQTPFSAGLSTPTEDAELSALRTLLDDPIVGPEARALLSAGSRREARDRHAMSVLLVSILSRTAHTIDVGAHGGAVLRDILRVAPAGRHIAYEPIPEFAQSLAEQFPAVTVRAAALSDKPAEASFIHVDSAPEYSGLREREYHGVTEVRKREITVRTERLDDALPDGFRPDFIKIDVEGAEMLVLRGAIETLLQFRPTIIFEHGAGASERYGTRPEDVWDLIIGELDMRIFDLDGRGPYSRERFAEVFAEPLWNWLAVPD